MALIAVSGHPGCRFDEVARFSAQRLGFELLTQSRVRSLASDEFGADAKIPDKAYPSLVTSILARLATQHHIVFCAAGGAENDVVLGGEARQNRGHQTGIGLVGNFGIGAELVASQRADAGLRQQLEAEPLRAEPRHLIETAPRMTRNRDQRHDTSSS